MLVALLEFIGFIDFYILYILFILFIWLINKWLEIIYYLEIANIWPNISNTSKSWTALFESF